MVLWFFSGGSADILFPLLFQSKLEFLPNVTSTYTVLAYGKKIFHKYVEFSNSNIQGHTGSICSFPITLVDEPLLCLVKAVEGRFCFKKDFLHSHSGRLVVMPMLTIENRLKSISNLVASSTFQIQGCGKRRRR